MSSYLLRVLNSLHNYAHTLEKMTTLPRTDHKHSIIILHKLSAVLVPNATVRQYITHKSSIVMLISSQVMQICPKRDTCSAPFEYFLATDKKEK